ncbi:MAG: DUF479 domain-containing protein [Alteromonadaceae bacterium]|nr:DUF479 domain-containing protein [Alteromonadaceae bacterium]
MNFLAHLFLAQPTADSYFGNLLGDFRRGVDLNDYPHAVRTGVANHMHVDKFTDHHPLVKKAKTLVSESRRRYAGIMLDILFDHFLIKHWQHYSHQSLHDFCEDVYTRLGSRVHVMPSRMQIVVKGMLKYRWLTTYQNLSGVGKALDRTAGRIRFANSFHGSIEEVQANYSDFEQAFTAFFPELIESVRAHNIEIITPKNNCPSY